MRFLTLFFLLTNVAFAEDITCLKAISGETFSIKIKGERATIKDPSHRSKLKCTNQTGQDLAFEIVCDLGDELLAYMYDGEEGAIVSNKNGMLDYFTCEHNLF